MKFPMFPAWKTTLERRAEEAKFIADCRRAGEAASKRLEDHVYKILLGIYHPSIAIQQSQPAATPQGASMFTVINNLVEPVTKLGSDVVVRDTLDLAGQHFLAVTDGGTVRLLNLDTLAVGDVAASTAYTVIPTATLTIG